MPDILHYDEPKLELITPAIALTLVGDHPLTISNQKENSLMHSYGRYMRSGLWEINGTTITIDKDGKVIDGIKRLIACIIYDTAFPCFIVTGIDRNTSITVDDHRKRQGSDAFYVSGRDNSAHLSTSFIILSSLAINHKMDSDRLHTNETLSFSIEYPEVTAVMENFKTLPYFKLITKALTVAFYALTQIIDPYKSDAFFEGINTAYNDIENDLIFNRNYFHVFILTLQKINDDTRIDAVTRRKLRRAFLIKTWNAFYTETEFKKLALEEDDEWPVISGLSSDPFKTYFEKRDTQFLENVEQKYAEDIATSPVFIKALSINTEIATSILTRNGPAFFGEESRNRKVSANTVNGYARDMSTYQWYPNGQTIKISPDNRLIDGQQRLLACIQSGKSFLTLVAYNVPQSAFHTLDTGGKRSFSVFLADKGVQNCNDIQKAVRIIWRHKNIGIDSVVNPTNSEMMNLWENDGALRALSSLDIGGAKSYAKLSHVIAIKYIADGIDKKKSDEFFQGFFSGSNLAEDSPALDLRDRLAQLRENSHRARNTERYRLLLIALAWDIFHKSGTGKIKMNQSASFPRGF